MTTKSSLATNNSITVSKILNLNEFYHLIEETVPMETELRHTPDEVKDA
jgi:hypothetical protein